MNPRERAIRLAYLTIQLLIMRRKAQATFEAPHYRSAKWRSGAVNGPGVCRQCRRLAYFKHNIARYQAEFNALDSEHKLDKL